MSRLWQKLKQEAGRDDISYPEHNPLTKEGKKVMKSMKKTYGEDRGEQVFYATMKNKKWHKK